MLGATGGTTTRLAVIQVCYRSADYIERGLPALVKQVEELGHGRIVIVDNASPDDSGQRLVDFVKARNYGHVVEVLLSERNAGFGAGNNHGIRHLLESGCVPDFVYLLNPDAFPAPNTLQGLISFLEAHPNASAAGGDLRLEDGTPQTSAFRFPGVLSEFETYAKIGLITRALHRHRVSIPGPVDRPLQVDWICGASMMIRTRDLMQAGLFDERFFLYFEEVELCKRLSSKGRPIHYVPGLEVIHISGASTGLLGTTRGRMPAYWFESRSYYFYKTQGRLGLLLCNLSALAGTLLYRLKMAVKGRGGTMPHFLGDLTRHSLQDLLRTF